MLPATEANRGSSMPLITGAGPDQSGLHGLVTRFVGAMSGPDPLMTAFEAISNDLTVRYGLEILLSNSNDDEDKKSLLLASKFEYSELQALVDDLFSSLQAREASVLLLSDFLARIWLSTLLLPSQLRAQGIKNVSIYPFATTPTSNVFEGAMLDGTPVAMKTFRRSQVRPATEEDVKVCSADENAVFDS
ncbi:hypothetical protein H0H87_001779 [Tephrocybe sp. NHM501043]|nr:hypothetical protein H0H87_001779 [Tephrocybe sp. NHM501043]